jgi:hypothetical protein
MAQPVAARSNSPWNVLAYGGKGEMHGAPVCHALAYFSKSPLRLDFDHDFAGENTAGLTVQAKVSLVGTVAGRKVFKVLQNVSRHRAAPAQPAMKILLVERRPGEFCDIYQNQYAYDPTNEMDETAILAINGRHVLKTYETDRQTWFIAYWVMGNEGPVRLNTDALDTAISSVSPAGARPFRGAVEVSGTDFTVRLYRAESGEKPLGRVELKLGISGDRLVAVSKRWIPD